MRISDWSSDECSSDLQRGRNGWNEVDQGRYRSCWNPLMSTWTVTGVSPRLSQYQPCDPSNGAVNVPDASLCSRSIQDRKSVVSGKSVSVRVDLGGLRIINKKKPR